MPAVGGRQFPLNQMTPPGTAAQWATNIGKANPAYFQPVRVSLPTNGRVTFFEGSADRPYELAAPAQAGLMVGHMYRMRVSEMPEFPGVDFFPSIELIDRLHPPAGKAEDFPVEFELTLEEFEWAASGRLVTKVVYLEQPDRVPLTVLNAKERIVTIEPSRNAIAEADSLGRPVAIVRLGGRTPDPHQPEPTFFGPSGPIQISTRTSQVNSQRRQAGNLLRPTSVGPKTGVVTIGPNSTRRIAQR